MHQATSSADSKGQWTDASRSFGDCRSSEAEKVHAIIRGERRMPVSRQCLPRTIVLDLPERIIAAPGPQPQPY
eukprot:5171027-Amphidinium_carterae.1